MSLQEELQAVGNAVENLKKEIRRAVLRMLGVDKLVKEAFEEGFIMGRELDPYSWTKEEYLKFYKIHSPWQGGVDEAWANSDVEEKV